MKIRQRAEKTKSNPIATEILCAPFDSAQDDNARSRYIPSEHSN